MQGYVFLAIAICTEIFATSMLKASEGFSRLLPGLLFILGMGISFYCLSMALISIPLSIAYAIWSGLGTVLTALVAILYWQEVFTLTTAIGIALIVIGVVLLNLQKGPA